MRATPVKFSLEPVTAGRNGTGPTSTASAAVAAITGAPRGGTRADVRDALAELGYGADEIGRVLVDLPADGDTSELLREALQRLAAA